MKYRTVVELICEGKDAEEAYHTAGEYLRGNVDNGVDMKCRTRPLRRLKIKQLKILSFVAVMLGVFN